jgi:hypothetical protein
MNLAKPRIDIGFATNDAPAALAFWQNEIGLPFDYTQPIRRGYKQHRHDLCGSILKINQVHERLSDNPPSGYLELLIARDIPAPRPMVDPEGNRVSLVPLRPGRKSCRLTARHFVLGCCKSSTTAGVQTSFRTRDFGFEVSTFHRRFTKKQQSGPPNGRAHRGTCHGALHRQRRRQHGAGWLRRCCDLPPSRTMPSRELGFCLCPVLAARATTAVACS